MLRCLLAAALVLCCSSAGEHLGGVEGGAAPMQLVTLGWDHQSKESRFLLDKQCLGSMEAAEGPVNFVAVMVNTPSPAPRCPQLLCVLSPCPFLLTTRPQPYLTERTQGKTGTGKSWLLHQLFGVPFRDNAQAAPVTQGI